VGGGSPGGLPLPSLPACPEAGSGGVTPGKILCFYIAAGEF